MTNNQDYTGRFINAAESIKKSLEKTYQARFTGLGEAYREALKRNHRVVRQHQDALKTFTDLRNVMQHSHVLNGTALATPRLDAVLAIEKISRQVEKPPRILDFMIPNPDVVASTDSLADAAEMVISRGYSQLPVYSEGKYQALFTTNALARWLSAAVQREEGNIIESDVKIADVLKYVEDHERPRFVKPTESAYKVCDLLSNEEPLPAVLVTTDGGENGQLQGIVTRFDVPVILRKIAVSFPQ